MVKNLYQDINKMKISDVLLEEITIVVNRYVPKGRDPMLHVDRRNAMIKVISKMALKGNVPLNRINILYLAKNWNNILHNIAQLNN